MKKNLLTLLCASLFATATTAQTTLEKWQAANPSLTPAERQRAGADFTEFFRTDTAYFEGVIDHYTPTIDLSTLLSPGQLARRNNTQLDMSAFIVYYSNQIVRTDQPITINVRPDGTFSGKFVIDYPGPIYIVLNNYLRFTYYFEPGKKLSFYLDEDALKEQIKSQNYYRLEDVGGVRLGGELAEINKQLHAAPEWNYEGAAEQKIDFQTLTPMAYRAKTDEAWRTYKAQMAAYTDGAQIFPKVKHILQKKPDLQRAIRLIDFTDWKTRLEYAQQDTANQLLKKYSIPEEYYSFLPELPWTDCVLLADDNGSDLVSRLELSKPFFSGQLFYLLAKDNMDNMDSWADINLNYYYEKLVELKKEGRKFDDTRESVFKWLKKYKGKGELRMPLAIELGFQYYMDVFVNNGGPLLYRSSSRTPTNPKATEELRKLLGDNVPAMMANKLDGRIHDTRMFIKKVQEVRQKADVPFLAQLMVARGAQFFMKEDCKDQPESEAYCDSLCTDIVPDHALQTQLRNSCAQMFRYPYEPEGEAADILKKLLAPYAGKTLMLDFWGTSCGSCRAGIQRMAPLREKYKDDDKFRFVYITGESESPVEAYNAYVAKNLQNAVCLRLSSADYQKMRELFHFNGIPRYVILSKSGKVIDENYSGMNVENDLSKWLEVE